MSIAGVKYSKSCILIIILICSLLAGCVSTKGDLDIEGEVIDEYSKKPIPLRNVIVQGLKENNAGYLKIDAGQFSTDSSGRFRYTLRKVEDARQYNFSFVGDSNYAFKTIMVDLYILEQNAKLLSFSLSKLVDLSIFINRKSKKPAYDTLSLAWVSDNIFFWSLFPYKIINYDMSNHFLVSTSGNELRWYGGYVNSVVKTRVFSGKTTKIYWNLDRYGKRIEFTDTITCKRDYENSIYFTY